MDEILINHRQSDTIDDSTFDCGIFRRLRPTDLFGKISLKDFGGANPNPANRTLTCTTRSLSGLGLGCVPLRTNMEVVLRPLLPLMQGEGKKCMDHRMRGERGPRCVVLVQKLKEHHAKAPTNLRAAISVHLRHQRSMPSLSAEPQERMAVSMEEASSQ